MQITLAEIQFLGEILKAMTFQVGSSQKMMLAESLQGKLQKETIDLLKAQKDAERKKAEEEKKVADKNKKNKGKNGTDKSPA